MDMCDFRIPVKGSQLNWRGHVNGHRRSLAERGGDGTCAEDILRAAYAEGILQLEVQCHGIREREGTAPDDRGLWTLQCVTLIYILIGDSLTNIILKKGGKKVKKKGNPKKVNLKTKNRGKLRKVKKKKKKKKKKKR